MSCDLCGQKMPNCDCTDRERELAEEVEELEEQLEAAREAIRAAQWMGEGGHWEEAACPFCRASPYGSYRNPRNTHMDGCIVERLGVVEPNDY